MQIVVQKFGGSSVATTKKLFNVCNHIIKAKDNNKAVVVVVSAQGDMTDNLIKEEKEIGNNINKREHDMLITVGEQITAAKLAMCLQSLGYDAISYSGWQLPIITDSNYNDANIIKINTNKVLNDLKNNKIVIVTGFQGVDKNGNITSLGRGGSDTTAISLAASLKASSCELFKDVDGIYNSDPNKNKNVKKYDSLSYDKALNIVTNGAQVLHDKSIIIAKKNDIKITVKSTFIKNSVGTTIG